MPTSKKITVYEVSELSPKAFRKAYQAWNEYTDMPFLQSMLNDECGQLLKEHGVICTSNHPVCLYSLSHSQGDGLMFEGSFEWGKYSIAIKHDGRYYHSNSKTIEMWVTGDDQRNPVKTIDEEYFEEVIYQSICEKLEKYGYGLLEDETSEAHFIDECNANEWRFTKDGVIFNE